MTDTGKYPPDFALRVMPRKGVPCVVAPQTLSRTRIGSRRIGSRRIRSRRSGKVHGDGLGTGTCDHAVDHPIDEIVYLPGVSEADLGFGRMDVDVNPLRRQSHRQHKGRVTTVVEHVAVCPPHGMVDEVVAHRAPVDEEILHVPLAAGEGRQTDPSRQEEILPLLVDPEGLFSERPANERGQALFPLHRAVRRLHAENRAAVVAERQANVESIQRHPAHRVIQVAELRLLGLQELTPRRRVEEQVTHFHAGALD